jgi:hypothetical protein
VKAYFGRVRRGLEEELDLGEDTMGQSRRVKSYLQAAKQELRAGGKKVRTLDVESLEDLTTRVLQAERKTEFERQALAFLFCGSLFGDYCLGDLVMGGNAKTELAQVGKVVVTDGCHGKQGVLAVDVQLIKTNHSKC